MAKKKQQSRVKIDQIITITGIIIVVLLGAYYLLTGSDPLGLFNQQATPEIIGSGGDWWHVYFTDPQNVDDPSNLVGSTPEKLIGYIDNAQQTIHIASFEFNLTPVAEALVAAHERGVEVKWITDDEHGIEADEEDDHGQFAMLEEAGIEIRDDDRGALMHNKFWIFDNQTLWTGSTNITVNGNFKNNNPILR